MPLPRRRLPRAYGSPRPARQANHDHRCQCDYEAGGHAALDAVLDVSLAVALDASSARSELLKISMGARLTRGLPRKVPQSVPRRSTYTGKLRVKPGRPGPELSAAPRPAASPAVESGPDRTHELAELTGRCAVKRSAHQR